MKTEKYKIVWEICNSHASVGVVETYEDQHVAERRALALNQNFYQFFGSRPYSVRDKVVWLA